MIAVTTVVVMPVEFLTDEQAVAYGSFKEVPTRPELERFFFLDFTDRRSLRTGSELRRCIDYMSATVSWTGCCRSLE